MMKKLFYILCLLVFVACSDDDDKNEVMMSDFDKPFTSISKSELKEMLQDFWLIDTIIDDYFEGHRMDVVGPIEDALDKYDVDIEDFFTFNTLNSRSTAAPVENKFTGMKIAWNPATHALDTTIDADGFIEILIPYSQTDDSRNNLRIVINGEWSNYTMKEETTFYLDGQLIMTTERLYNEDKDGLSVCITENTPPYFYSYKASENSQANFPSLEFIVRKEGGPSLLQSVNLENGNLVLLTEYNNLRAHVTVNQYNNFLNLVNQLEDNNNKLALELYKKNMSAVIVFTDRDEKIGDLDVYPDEEDDDLPLICRFQDGEEFRLPLIFFND